MQSLCPSHHLHTSEDMSNSEQESDSSYVIVHVKITLLSCCGFSFIVRIQIHEIEQHNLIKCNSNSFCFE